MSNVSSKLPRHVAIIQDGNGRWAQERGLLRMQGHVAGYETTRAIVQAAIESGIEVLSLFAFSTENWQRPRLEVEGLMMLFHRAIDEELHRFHEQNVRICFIGERDKLAQGLRDKMRHAEETTRANSGLVVQLAVSYGGRWDITEAARTLAKRCQSGDLAPEDITEEMLAGELSTHELGEPDLLIRTSGEERISNFFLWQLAYTEFYFPPCYWPDFDKVEFKKALNVYTTRQRRFGKERVC